MADNNFSKPGNPDSSKHNQTMQREQAKAEVSGGKSPEDVGRDKRREENSAIGGDARSQTGEPGRARSELDQDRTEPTGQR